MRRNQSVYYCVTLLVMMLAALLLANVTLAQDKNEIANLIAPAHPNEDRTFWVKLNKGIDIKGMNAGAEIPIDGKLIYHKTGKDDSGFDAMVSIKKISKNKVEIRILWFVESDKYYYPNAILQAVYINDQLVGMPNEKHPEQISLRKLAVKGSETINALDVKVPGLKVDLQGQQIIVLGQTTFTEIYQGATSLWGLGFAAYKKISGIPQPLPPEKTTLAFTFKRENGCPDVDTNRSNCNLAQRKK